MTFRYSHRHNYKEWCSTGLVTVVWTLSTRSRDNSTMLSLLKGKEKDVTKKLAIYSTVKTEYTCLVYGLKTLLMLMNWEILVFHRPTVDCRLTGHWSCHLLTVLSVVWSIYIHWGHQLYTVTSKLKTFLSVTNLWQRWVVGTLLQRVMSFNFTKYI